MNNNIDTQIGCGYCAHEKSCQLRLTAKTNFAKAGCPGFIHHENQHNQPGQYDLTVAVVDIINRNISEKVSEYNIDEFKKLAAAKLNIIKDEPVFDKPKSKYHK